MKVSVKVLVLFLALGAMRDGVAQTSTVNLTLEQTHTIKEIVLKDYNFPRLKPGNFTPGDPPPPEAELQRFPEPVTSKIPGTQALRFFLSGDQIVIVSGGSDSRIAEVIK